MYVLLSHAMFFVFLSDAFCHSAPWLEPLFFPEALTCLPVGEKSHAGQLFPVQQMKLKKITCMYKYRMGIFLHSIYDILYILLKYTFQFSRVVQSLSFILLSTHDTDYLKLGWKSAQTVEICC